MPNRRKKALCPAQHIGVRNAGEVEAPEVIKIDVAGAEEHVPRASRRALERRPLVFLGQTSVLKLLLNHLRTSLQSPHSRHLDDPDLIRLIYRGFPGMSPSKCHTLSAPIHQNRFRRS
jgi:hypothetical protein